MLSISVKSAESSSFKKKCLSYIDMMSQNELGCSLCSDQGFKLSCKVSFVTFEQLVEELPFF